MPPSSRPSKPARRPRRTSAEVRHLILAAARDVFGREGYSGATTREIADRADVADTVLFSNYATKEALFKAAVVEPLNAFLSEFAEHWMDSPLLGGSPSELMREYTEALYAMVKANRNLFASLYSNGLAGSELQTALRHLDQLGVQLAKEHGLIYDTPVAVRSGFLMVVSVALFEDQLFVGDADVGEQRIIDELTRILTAALTDTGTVRRSRRRPPKKPSPTKGPARGAS